MRALLHFALSYLFQRTGIVQVNIPGLFSAYRPAELQLGPRHDSRVNEGDLRVRVVPTSIYRSVIQRFTSNGTCLEAWEKRPGMKQLNLLGLLSGIALLIQGCGVAGSQTRTGITDQGTARVHPTSLQLTVAPCDSNLNCVTGSTAATGQLLKITAHVIYTGTTKPTGQLCVLDNGSTLNCNLIPAANEQWFTNSLAPGINTLVATYAGDSVYAGSTASAAVTVGTGGSPAPPKPIPSGQLIPSPANLNFGNTTVGTSSTLPVTLTNSGNSAISISNVVIAGPGFGANGLSGTILSPGQSASLSVTWAPAATGSVSGTVTIVSDAANSSTVISLSGAGVQVTVSSITLSPANPTIAVGDQVQFKAVDNLGNNITSSVTWSSSDPSIASVTTSGLAKGLAEGPVAITATK
jgi:plastocyanin